MDLQDNSFILNIKNIIGGILMLGIKIQLNTLPAEQKLAMIAEKYPDNIRAISEGYIVNAKSVLGILSLDLSKPVMIEFCEVKNGNFYKFTDELSQAGIHSA